MTYQTTNYVVANRFSLAEYVSYLFRTNQSFVFYL